MIARRNEMRTLRRVERESIGDASATDGEMVARLVIGDGRTRKEMEPREVDDIVLREIVDRIAEVMG
jgi:hypothetical protein